MQRSRGARALLLAAAAALLAAMPAAAGAAVSTGHSGWSWANPAPQGEDLTDVAFSGSTGYAVGRFGALLRSTDAGATWSGLPSSTFQDLARVSVAGPTGLVATGACAVRRSVDSGTTLTPVDVGGGDTGCGATIAGAAFADPANGLIVFTSGVVLATSDGGVTLARRTPVPGNPTDVVPVSATTAYATSGNGIYRTIDGGGSWTLAALTARTLRSITFATPAVGYAVGDAGTVLKTIDGGGSWLPVASPDTSLPLAEVRCADANLCLITTGSGGSIVRTPDGGVTWSRVTPSAKPVRGVAFASPARVVAVGDGGTTVTSDDGGVTWGGAAPGAADQVFELTAGAGGFAYGWDPTSISVTADGGATWRAFGIPTPRTIRAVGFADPQTGFVQDDGGTLRRTLNGGASWQILDPAGAGALQGIVTLSPSRVLLVTGSGVFRSTDGGTTFARVRSAALTRSKVIRGEFIGGSGSGNRAFLVGRAGILVSTDGGATWTQRRPPKVGAKAPAIARGDCIAPATCWVITSGSRVYRTTDLGRHWTGAGAGLGAPARLAVDIAAAGPREAYVTFSGTAYGLDSPGLLLHTTDAGRTWSEQLVASSTLTAFDAVAGRAWAVAYPNHVFTTTTGGATATPSTLTITASRKAVTRPTTITITGRLRGAQGGEQVTLYGTGSAARELTVASSGTFTATYRVKRTTTFVAQWPGDGVRSGDGTPALVVRRR